MEGKSADAGSALFVFSGRDRPLCPLWLLRPLHPLRLPRSWRRCPRAIRATLAALVALTAGACGRERPAELRLPAGTPIVLVSIDTLRADHLPAYGYPGVATPAIDALARDGVLCERAYAQTPLTLPSHSSALTGLLPAEHGVRDNVGYRLDPQRIESGALPFLPWQLKALGYATGAAVSAFVLDRKTGFATGFERYDDGIELKTGRGLGGLQRAGTETLAAGLAWLREVGDRPVFLFLHFYEPHAPYTPPEPFAGRHALKYDGEIATADALVGDLVAELKARDLYDRAAIVLMSDHGEGLSDHGEAEHGVLLHVEALHVPLLLKLPGGRFAGERVTVPAALTDIAPTLLGLLGAPVTPAQKGLSLLALLDPASPRRRIYSETFYPRLHFGWSDLASLIDGESHLIAGPAPELFDLVADPRERRNVLADRRRLYAELSRELDTYDRTLVPPSAVDEESRQAMAALGYIGSAQLGQGPLPDPKSHLGLLADLQEGFRLQSEKRHAEAIVAFRRVLAENPRMADAWEAVGKSSQRLGETSAAIAAYRKALETGDGAPHVALELASIYFQLDQMAEAEAHAQLALAGHGSFAHGLLAKILAKRSDFAGAEREARAALAGASQRIGPLLTLAEVQHAAGRLDEALASLAEAEKAYGERKTPDPELLQGLALERGKVLADQGDAPAAEGAFAREIALFPEDPRAYSHLALLYALTGRGAAVGPTLKRMVEACPGAVGWAEAVRALRAMGNTQDARALLATARARFPESEELRRLAVSG